MKTSDFFTHKTGVVVDGNAFLYRTYHLLKHRSDGELSSGLIAYSFINQIRSSIQKLGVMNPVPYLIWDGEDSRASRQVIYSPYNLNRPTPDTLFLETRDLLTKELHYICPRLYIQFRGVEADDLIYLMVTKLSAHINIKDWIICTRDEDLLQCLDEEGNIRYYNPYTKKIWDYSDFVSKYGFTPTSLVLYKALVGDKADNWPGVSGVGDKTAKKWLAQGNTIEEQLEYIAMQLRDNKKTYTFAKGLSLCELPLPMGHKDAWIAYLVSILHSKRIHDWQRLHDTFAINDVKKAQFIVGDPGE